MSEPAGGSPAVADVPASGPGGADLRTQVRPRRLRRAGLVGCAALLLGASALTSAGTAVPSTAKLPGSAYVQADLALEAELVLEKVPQDGFSPLILIAQSMPVGKAPHRDPFNESAVCASYPVAPGSYRISSPYGYRVHPIFGNYSMHMGDDYAAPLGTPIHAVTDGTVVYTGPGRLGRSSELVIIEHTVQDTTFYSWYVHMYPEGVFVEVGQQVLAGEVIAEVGNNGNSTGPHLHFEIHTSDPGVGLQKTPVGRTNAAHVIGVFPDATEDPSDERSKDPSDGKSTDPGDEDSGDEKSTDPGDEDSEDPSDEKSTDPADEDSEDPGDENSTDPADEDSEDPGDEDAEDPSDGKSEEPTDEESEGSSEEPTDEASEAPSDKPSDEASEQPSQQPTEDSEEPTEEPTDEPAEEPTEEETEEPSEEPAEESTQDEESEEAERRTRTPFPTHAYGTTVDPTTFLASLGLTMVAPNQCLIS